MSYQDRSCNEEVTFPNGVTDWEVIEKAKEFQRFEEVEYVGSASESITNKVLVRITELARDLTFDIDEYQIDEKPLEAIEVQTDITPSSN